MKLSTVSLLALSAAAVNARFVEQHETNQVVLADVEEQLYLIELAPGKTQWVTEEEKWELRRASKAQESGSPYADNNS
jgi:leucyl aminopeptidase